MWIKASKYSSRYQDPKIHHSRWNTELQKEQKNGNQDFFFMLISRLKVEMLGCCCSETEITEILTGTDNEEAAAGKNVAKSLQEASGSAGAAWNLI